MLTIKTAHSGSIARHDITVEVTVDWDKLAAYFARKLIRSKSTRSIIQGGAVVARRLAYARTEEQS